MKKIVIATTFAAVTLAAYSAAACDWNREARANDPVVATTAPPTTTGQASQGAAATLPRESEIISAVSRARGRSDHPLTSQGK